MKKKCRSGNLAVYFPFSLLAAFNSHINTLANTKPTDYGMVKSPIWNHCLCQFWLGLDSVYEGLGNIQAV